MSFLYVAGIFGFLFLCILVCFVILIQEGKGGGLGASFGGGADAADSLFGASTPEILKKVTAYLGVIFVVSCVILSFWTGSLGRKHMRAVDTEAIQNVPEE